MSRVYRIQDEGDPNDKGLRLTLLEIIHHTTDFTEQEVIALVGMTVGQRLVFEPERSEFVVVREQ